nr:hypothetical protein [Fodinibius sp.]NIW43588.1 hypothetical protein [Gammaproteobacteria bacterium]NIY23835.1 hypothetical protein [Fodinibius sp.]
MKYSKAVMLLWVVLLLASSMFNNAVSQGMCGDANDDGKLDVSDALWILNYSAGGPPPMPQVLCGDANGNGFVNLADFVYIIDYIFIGSPAPGDCSGGCDPFTGPGDGTYDFGPGIPDTIEVVSVQVDPSPTEDIVFSVPVHIVNDEDISALSLGFYYDSDDIEMDSISLTGGVASGFYNKSQVYPSQNLGIIGFHPLYAGATPISPGEGLLASMWFTLPAGVSDQTISIDSGFASPAAFFIISTSSGSPFKPYFESGATITVGVGDFELFSPAVNYDANGSDIYYITVFDADGDTDIDVATSNCGTDDISVIMNNGDGTFGTVVNYAADNCPYGVSAADLDNDDDMDLIVSNSWADNVQTFYNNGAGSFTLWHTYTVGGGADEPRISCVADFDDDGDYDLAVPFVASDDIYIGYNDGSGYISWWDSYLAGNGPNSVIATQLNSDNNLDLAVANQHDGNIAIFTND